MIERPKPRGGTGRGQGRPTTAGTGATSPRQVTLDDGTVSTLRALGDGNLSAGIREAARRLRDEG
jgi:hypothetical protein